MIFTAHDGEDRSGADVSQVKVGGYTPPSLTAACAGGPPYPWWKKAHRCMNAGAGDVNNLKAKTCKATTPLNIAAEISEEAHSRSRTSSHCV